MQARVRAWLFGVCAVFVGVADAAVSLPAGRDPTFGTGGVVALSPYAEYPLVAVLPDARVRVVDFDANADTLELRGLKENGAPDPTFGTDGVIRTHFNLAPAERVETSDFRIDVDGGLTFALLDHFPLGDPRIGLARTTASGTPDAVFGGMRWLTLAGCVVYAERPRWIRAGSSYFVALRASCGERGEVVHLWKLRADATLDSSFGQAGQRDVPAGALTFVGMMPLPEGTLQLLWRDAARNSRWQRLRADGADDPDFGPGGVQPVVFDGVPQRGAVTLTLRAEGGAYVLFDRTLRAVNADGRWDRDLGGTGGVTLLPGHDLAPYAQLAVNAGVVALSGDRYDVTLRTLDATELAYAARARIKGDWSSIAVDSRGRFVAATTVLQPTYAWSVVRYDLPLGVATPAPIPASSTWSLLVAGVLLVGLGAVRVRTRRSSATW